MSKKEVKYIEVAIAPVVGGVAVITADEHYRIGPLNPDRQIVRTSTVVAVNEDGSFETQNSLYVPVDAEAGQRCLEMIERQTPKSQTL